MREISPDVILELSRLPSYEETEIPFMRRYLSARLAQARAEKPDVGFLMIRSDAADKIVTLLKMSEEEA